MLKRVTITGADDKVDYGDLIRLQEEFPFVEWGVLLAKIRGAARTWRWVMSIPRGLVWSAHFCGEYARTILGGFRIPLHVLEGSPPGRVQLNGYHPGDNEELKHVIGHFPNIEFILQVRSADELQAAKIEALEMPVTSVLFDPSGGRGLAAQGVDPMELRLLGVHTGYAGGINPVNVVDVLRNFGEAVDWIDMETGVRTNNRLDLYKVRSVLDVARSYISRQKGF